MGWFFEDYFSFGFKNPCIQKDIRKKVTVLVFFECCNKNTIDWVTYKQQKFISHSSGDWEVQDLGTSRFSVW